MSENNPHFMQFDAGGAPPMRKYRNLVGGNWCDPLSHEWLETLNPANGEPWALIPKGGAADAERAVAAARAAFESPAWRNLSASARGDMLRRVATALEGSIESIAAIETRGNGKRLVEALAQLRYLPRYFHYFPDHIGNSPYLQPH